MRVTYYRGWVPTWGSKELIVVSLDFISIRVELQDGPWVFGSRLDVSASHFAKQLDSVSFYWKHKIDLSVSDLLFDNGSFSLGQQAMVFFNANSKKNLFNSISSSTYFGSCYEEIGQWIAEITISRVRLTNKNFPWAYST